MVSPKNNYKRRYHNGQASVFHQLFVKDDLSKPALAFTWWAPHGPKMNDEKEDDTSANIGKRRVQVGEQPGGQGGSLLSFRGWQGVREEGGKQLQHVGWSRRRYCDCGWISLRSLSHSNNFYDVTLVPEDGKVEKAHKIVLSIRSTFYKMTTRGGLGWNNQISRWLAMIIDWYIFEDGFLWYFLNSLCTFPNFLRKFNHTWLLHIQYERSWKCFIFTFYIVKYVSGLSL